MMNIFNRLNSDAGSHMARSDWLIFCAARVCRQGASVAVGRGERICFG
ncbi:hypothetical protein MtrunA17_Chr3g0107821 [Medicago truncatula]|uniref:Uncharacterized protein n=1 Tax=Medicago truncatula TaxID=3880 RepID=A0A396IU50_MEDTR|nr:hypothetical protein MtrunA17_Chr3g0107821 [Medicago truncatula]